VAENGKRHDLESAFPRVWHHLVLQTLHELGLRGQLPSPIHNYLLNRSFQVRVSSTLSSLHLQANGIPQGSPLSNNTLFIIALNKIFTIIAQSFHPILFVDDLSIHTYTSNLKRAQKLETALTSIATWLSNHGFRISLFKSKFAIFEKQHSKTSPPLLLLNQKPIPYTNLVKVLGLSFTQITLGSTI